MEAYAAQYESYLLGAQGGLEAAADSILNADTQVGKAAQYSLMAGGKRVRAVLCMAVCHMLAGDAQTAARFAAAVEMLHACSLIHDDLPCMDDDDMRRGKPSCHKAFGEATALLAGDALLAAAFEAIATAPCPPEQGMQATQALARATGTHGMILGQELDLYHETVAANYEQLQTVHRKKTGCLIDAAVRMGAIAANMHGGEAAPLQAYADAIGLAFQIVDDVLDVTSTAQALGKPIGSDAQSNKTTFVTLFGTEKAMEMANDLTKAAIEGLQAQYGEKSVFLCKLAATLLERVN